MFFSFVIIHICICLLYYVICLFRFPKNECFIRLLFALAAPIFGLISLVFADIFKGRTEEISDSVDMLSKKRSFHFVEAVDKKKGKDVVPLEEVLLVNDYVTKRKVLLDIFKGNPEKYIKELKIALNDPDTETSHYASAALMEISRKFLNSIIILSKQVEEDKSNKAAKREYVSLLREYIKSDIADISNKQKYQREFIRCASELLLDGDRSVSADIYRSLVLYAYDLNLTYEASYYAEKFIDVFPENEKSYFTQMQILYNSGKQQEFQISLQTLRNSSVMLTKEGLSTLRFFLGK